MPDVSVVIADSSVAGEVSCTADIFNHHGCPVALIFVIFQHVFFDLEFGDGEYFKLLSFINMLEKRIEDK